jgi:hypothetical protein
LKTGVHGVGDQSPGKKELYDMKHLKIAGLCLVAVFAASAMATASASALAWEDCQEGSGSGKKYTEHQCTTLMEPGGKWEWQTLSSPEAVISTATLKLRDIKAVLGKNVEVECTGTDTGTIGPGAEDKISTVTVTSCKNLANCPGTIKAEARNLEWKTELVEEGGKQKDKIRAGTGGAPGWKVECTGISDTCTSESGDTFMENLSNGTVNAIFKKEESGKATCSITGKESGEVEGTVNIKRENGWAIRAS